MKTRKPTPELPSTPPPIWGTLERIRGTLGLSDQDFAGWLELPLTQYRRMRSAGAEPWATSILALGERLELGFEALMLGEIDYRALALHFEGRRLVLPEKYSVHAQSRRRTVVNLLDYIEKRLGWQSRAQVLRRFQVNESMFEDLDAPINLRLSVDLSSWILRYHSDPGLLVEMGANAVRTHRGSVVGKELSRARDVRELFERMFGGVAEQFIEKNFRWSIHRFSRSRLTLRGVPDAALVATLGKEYMHNFQGCLIRQGFVSTIPAYLGHSAARVTKSRCVCAGDGFCEFEVDLTLPLMRPAAASALALH